MRFEDGSHKKGNKQMKKTEKKETAETIEINETAKKEMKKLSRAELLDIIYEMKKNEEELKNDLRNAQEELKKREIVIEKSGSIAEASLALNGVFEAAQQAADAYIQSVKSQYENMEAKNNEAETERQQIINEAEATGHKIVKAAEAEGDKIIEDARQRGAEMIAEAKEDIRVREDTFKQVMKKMIEAGAELKKSLKQENGYK